MECILNITYPMITSYTHHAHLLAILGEDERRLEWIYSNYIQIYINKDLRKSNWADFYFPMPYEIKPFEICKWIETEKCHEEFIDKRHKDIVACIKDFIKRKFYVHMMINYKYISESRFAKKGIDRRHDVLVYGFDDKKKIIYCADFTFDSTKYTFFQCAYKEFKKAYNNDYVKKEPTYLNHFIYAYRLKENCDYEYDIGNIIFWLRQYVSSSVPEYWQGFNNKNCKDIMWGLSYYDGLCANMEEASCDFIDIRFIYLLLDHHNMMKGRLIFIQRELESLKEYIDKYDMICDSLRVAINLSIKFNLYKDRKWIDKIAKRIREAKAEEQMLLQNVIEQLERGNS